ARISNILIAICLGKEEAQADATGNFGICRIEALGARDRGTQVNDIIEGCIRSLRVRGRRLHGVEQTQILIQKGLVFGIEIGWRNSKFVRSSDLGWKR